MQKSRKGTPLAEMAMNRSFWHAEAWFHLPALYVRVCISDYGLHFLKLYREVYLWLLLLWTTSFASFQPTDQRNYVKTVQL